MITATNFDRCVHLILTNYKLFESDLNANVIVGGLELTFASVKHSMARIEQELEKGEYKQLLVLDAVHVCYKIDIIFSIIFTGINCALTLFYFM